MFRTTNLEREVRIREKIENEIIERLDAALERVFMRYRGFIISPATLLKMGAVYDKHTTPWAQWVLTKSKELLEATVKINNEETKKIREELKMKGVNFDVPKRGPKKRQRKRKSPE